MVSAPITTIRAYAGVKQLFCFRPLIDNAFPVPTLVPEPTDVSGVTVTTGIVSDQDPMNPYAGMAFALIDGGTVGGTGSFTLWVNFPYLSKPIGYPVKVEFYDTVITAPPRPSIVVPPAYFSGVGRFTATIKGQKRVGNTVFSGIGNVSIASIKGTQKVSTVFSGLGGFVSTIAAVPIIVPTLARVDSNTPVAGDEELFEITNFDSYASTFSFSPSATAGTAAVYGKYVLWKTPNTTTTETLSVNAISQYGGVSNAGTAVLNLTSSLLSQSTLPTLVGDATIELGQLTELRFYNKGRFSSDTQFTILTSNLTVNQISGQLSNIIVTNGGTLYPAGTLLDVIIPPPSNPLGRQAVAKALVNSAGVVFRIIPIDCGSGYDTMPNCTLPASSGTQATCLALMDFGSGFTHVSILDGGIATASTVPTITCPPPDIAGGTQATFTAVIARGVITTPLVSGGNYTKKPSIGYTGGGTGTAASFDCDWNSSTGEISNVRPLQRGNLFTAAPTITVTRASGDTGTVNAVMGTATIGWYLQGVNPTNVGTGYTSDKVLTVSGGAFTVQPTLSAAKVNNANELIGTPQNPGKAHTIIQVKEVGKRKSKAVIRSQNVLQATTNTFSSLPNFMNNNYPIIGIYSASVRLNPAYTGALMQAKRLSDNATLEIDENTTRTIWEAFKGTARTITTIVYSQFGTPNWVNPTVTASGINTWNETTHAFLAEWNPNTNRVEPLQVENSRMQITQPDLRNVWRNGVQINDSTTPPTGLGFYALVTTTRRIGGTGNNFTSPLFQWHTYRRAVNTGNFDTSTAGMASLWMQLGSTTGSVISSSNLLIQNTTAGATAPNTLQSINYPPPVTLQANEPSIVGLDVFGASHTSGNNVLRASVNGAGLDQENGSSAGSGTWNSAGYALTNVRLNGDAGTPANVGNLELGSLRTSAGFAPTAASSTFGGACWWGMFVITGKLDSANNESAEKIKAKLQLHMAEAYQRNQVNNSVSSDIAIDFRNKTIASNSIPFDRGNLTLQLNSSGVASARTNDTYTGVAGDNAGTTGTPRVYSPNFSIGTLASGFKGLRAGRDTTKTLDVAGAINPYLANSNIANRAKATGSGTSIIQTAEHLTIYLVGQRIAPVNSSNVIDVTDYELIAFAGIGNGSLTACNTTERNLILTADHGSVTTGVTGITPTLDPNAFTYAHIGRSPNLDNRPREEWIDDNKNTQGTGGSSVIGYHFKAFGQVMTDSVTQFQGYANSQDFMLRNTEYQKGNSIDFSSSGYQHSTYKTPILYFMAITVENKPSLNKLLLGQTDNTIDYRDYWGSQVFQPSDSALREIMSATVSVFYCPLMAPFGWAKTLGSKVIKNNAIACVPDEESTIILGVGTRNSHPVSPDARLFLEVHSGKLTEIQHFDKLREFRRKLITDTFV